MSNFTPVKPSSRPHAHRVPASPASPIRPSTPTIIYGRVLAPNNSVNQLKNLTSPNPKLDENVSHPASTGIALGGAWKDLQIRNLKEVREKEDLLARTLAAELSAERMAMQNEDLVTATVRLEYELSKVRCYDISLENKLDSLVIETESLRSMHNKAVEELEVQREGNKEKEARMNAMCVVMEKNGGEKVRPRSAM